jgi:hypothetical protein
VAFAIGARPLDLWNVFCSESQADPTSVNYADHKRYATFADAKKAGTYALAVGLNQLTKVAAVEAGLMKSTDSFQDWAEGMSKAPISEQLYACQQFFKSTGWFKAKQGYESALRLYLANASPSYLFADLSQLDKPILSGSEAEANKERSTIGGLQQGLVYWRAKPLFTAGQMRLAALFLQL